MFTQEIVTVTENKPVAEGYFKLSFNAPELAKNYDPIQFVNVKVGSGTEFLLRKPFSIYDHTDTDISILFKIYGKGTERLSQYKTGDSLDILGPLGTGVVPPKDNVPTALIVGGVGIGSVKALALKMPKQFDLFYGVRNQGEVVEKQEWSELANTVFMCSDDGSCGEKGVVSTLFQKQASAYKKIYVCGPHAMLKAVYDVCPETIESFFITEEYMACGFGICMGCVIKTTSGYKRICKEGPVFKGSEIIW
ncbi:MAG: dihydroorotate dehydrogenase electron transfer subunit [Candidatus Margulisbacteria bacterium]|nr:dihydroorotate dehydrogenase electron transfer subunit [Candidatus Margulisiibacteriota bacterium]